MRYPSFRRLVYLTFLAVVVATCGFGCASNGTGSVHVRYGVGMGPWWPHDYHWDRYWDRRPIYVGPPVYPELPPEPSLPIEPPPELIAVPYMD